MTEPKSTSDQISELKAKLDAMGLRPFEELGKLARLMALPQVMEVAAPGLLVAMAQSDRLLCNLAALSGESVDQIHKRYGEPPKTSMLLVTNEYTKLADIKTQVDLYNGVLDAVTRYYAYNGRFTGIESPP